MLWKCNLTGKVPFALQLGVSLVLKALRNEVTKGKPCRRSPVMCGGIPDWITDVRSMQVANLLPTHPLKLTQPSDFCMQGRRAQRQCCSDVPQGRDNPTEMPSARTAISLLTARTEANRSAAVLRGSYQHKQPLCKFPSPNAQVIIEENKISTCPAISPTS